MKHFFLIIVVVFATGSCAKAQSDEKPQYLFGADSKVSVKGFGAVINEFSAFKDNFSFSTGGGGAVLLNQKFFFGAYGMGMTTQHSYALSTKLANGTLKTYTDLRTQFGHGGFWIGYIHDYKKLIHWSASTKIGWGSISFTDRDYKIDYHDELGYDQVFVLTPQVEAELNIAKWFKINAGIGYRFVTGVNQSYPNINGIETKFFKSTDFNTPQFSLGLLFGNFSR